MQDLRLEKIKQSPAKDLKSRQVYNEIATLTQEYQDYIYIGESKELRQYLLENLSTSGVQKNDPKLYQQYLNIIDRLSWVSLTMLSKKELEELFSFKLLLGARMQIIDSEIVGSLAEKTVGVFQFNAFDLKEASTLRLLLTNALKKNQEILGSRDVNIDDENMPPEVGNWLKDYDQSVKIEKRQERISLLEYINSSKNVPQLSEDDKKVLRIILELYDLLRFFASASTVAETGHSLPQSRITVLEDSFLIDDDAPDVSLSQSSQLEQEVLTAYQGDQILNKKIKKELDKVKSKFKDDSGRLRAEFFAAVQKQNIARTIAILAVMAQQEELENFLVEDEKLNEFLIAVWSKQFSQDVVKEFRKEPKQLKFVKMFLRYIFEQRLGLDSSEAARIGLQISNIFVSLGKKSYNKVAYFDIESKTFKWFD